MDIIQISKLQNERRYVAELGDKSIKTTRRGPKPQARKKMLLSMTVTEYDEFSAWADDDGVTKAALMHDLMERERARRAARKLFGLEPSMYATYEESTQWGGVIWRGDNLAGSDAGRSLLDKFISEHPHDGWTLSIYNTLSETTAEIDCPVEEIPQITALVYNLEHAAPMTFIGENPASESYVVGMRCTRGRLDFPGIYRAEGGKLKPVAFDGLDG